MESWPTNYSELEDGDLPTTAAAHRLVYSVYQNERRAARAAHLLVEAGFPPDHVYIGVQRNGELQQAHAGRKYIIGYGALVGSTLSASIGAMLVAAAALGFIALPLGPLAGLSAITACVLALLPAAIPGAIVGALIGLWRWNRGNPNFPAEASNREAFVAVEVSPGNMPDAELTLHEPHRTLLGHAEDWRKLARETLHLDRAA